MSDLLSKAPFMGLVEMLLVNPKRETGLEKSHVPSIRLLFTGIEGDCHGGLTRKSDSRMLKQFKRGTEVRNTRQVSILSVEELADIAQAMGIPEVKPEWVGANLVTRGHSRSDAAAAFDAPAISLRRHHRYRPRKSSLPLSRRGDRQTLS